MGLRVDPFPSWVAAKPFQFSLHADGCSLGVSLPFSALHKAPGLARLCQIFTYVPGSPLSLFHAVGVDIRDEKNTGLIRVKCSHETEA